MGATLFNNNIGAGPYGQFDIGASTGPGFEGGGNPSKGIAIGASETFIFSLTGSNLNTLSVPPGDGEGTQSFVARFRGIEVNPGSDKVPVNGVDDIAKDPDLGPEPATMFLFGSGLIGAFLR